MDRTAGAVMTQSGGRFSGTILFAFGQVEALTSRLDYLQLLH